MTSFGSPARTLSIGSGTPITPVEATSTCFGGMPSRSPTIFVISRAALRPSSPVQTFEQPLDATIAWAAPPPMCSIDTSTGAPFT